MTNGFVVLAGATGDLGLRIARALIARGASVKALVRRQSAAANETLHHLGVSCVEVDFDRVQDLREACDGATCVVSAVSGLREVIVELQGRLLEAAVAAGCPRFIPSDFAADFTRLPPGANRNFDLRLEFKERLDKAAISATSILNGAFADMLTGQAPFLLPRVKRVLAWGNADQKMDFTTKDDVASFTAAAALDSSTPRILRIAGDQVSARDLAAIATEISGTRYQVFRAGSLERLDLFIRIARALDRKKSDIYPAWQGMQYMRDMYSGAVKLETLDNGRYPDLRWTPVRAVLAGDPRLAKGR